MKAGCLATFLLATALLNGGAAFGADVSLHGFAQGQFTPRVTGKTPPNAEGGDFILGEERLRIDLAASNESGSAGMNAKVDFFHDAIANRANVDLREAYGEYNSKYVDFRAGRQIVTWGVGDLVFINDVFPKDWFSFFAGRPIEYLKIGSDAINIELYPKIFSAEIVVIPLFQADNLPASNRFFVSDPFPQIPAAEQQTQLPAKDLKNMVVALRIYREIAGFDASLYFSRGFWLTPSPMLDNIAAPASVTYIYPRLYTYGASAQRSVLGGVFSAEAGYFDSPGDRSGTDMSIPNPQARYLAGYKRPLWKEATIGLQYYGEYMFRHAQYKANLSAGYPVRDRLYQLVTLRFTQPLAHQTLKFSLFSFFSPSEVDYMIIPEIQYHFTDELWAALGANVFGGRKSDTFFGQSSKNDNVYLVLRYEF